MTLEQCLLCNIWEKLITTSPIVCGFKHKNIISKGFLPYDVIQKLLQFGQSHRKVSFQGTQQVLGLLLRLHLTQFKMPLLALNILSCKFSDKYSYEYETKEPLKEDHSFLLKLAVQGRGRGLLHKLQNAWKKAKILQKVVTWEIYSFKQQYYFLPIDRSIWVAKVSLSSIYCELRGKLDGGRFMTIKNISIEGLTQVIEIPPYDIMLVIQKWAKD